MKQSKSDQSRRDSKSPFGRRPLTYVLSIVILAIIAVALIGGPAISGAVRVEEEIFGEYAGEPIQRLPGNFFQRRLGDWARYFNAQGAQEDAQTVYQIFQLAYSDTVLHMARLHEANQIGAGVSSDFVDTQIAQWPAFQVDGRFSAEAFNSMPAAELLTLREYIGELATTEQVRLDFAAAASVSDAEVEFIAEMASLQHKFRYVEFGFAAYPEAEVVAYGEDNPSRFSRINLSQITIGSSLADAENIRQQAVDRTSSFEDLAVNQSTDEFAEDGGERGWVYNWDLEFDFEDPEQLDELFALREGEISPVYETGAGFRIYRVNETPLDPDFTDSTTVAEVRTYLTNFERGRIEDYLRETANEFVASARSDGFAAAAQSIDQLPQSTGYSPANYGNVRYLPQLSAEANAVINSAGAYREDFVQSLFALGPGEISEPLVLRDYVFVFELEDIRELDDAERESLSDTVRVQVPQDAFAEGNQAVIDDDLYVDEFVQGYTAAVLGQ